MTELCLPKGGKIGSLLEQPDDKCLMLPPTHPPPYNSPSTSTSLPAYLHQAYAIQLSPPSW